MARNPSDVYSKLPGSVAVTGAVVDSSDYNDQLDDIVNALNDVAMLSGSKPFTGDQSMGSHKLTSVTDGAALQDAATVAQVQNGVVQHATTVGGTADDILLTMTPAKTTWVSKERIRWTSGGANTVVAPTISKDAGSTDITIKKGAGAALAVGDTGASGYICEGVYNGTDLILLNPAGSATAATTTEQLTGTSAAAFATPDSVAALWEAGADITDGAAITIGEGGYFNLITSTTAITSFVVTTDKAGRTFRVRFNTARTLTHNGTSLIIPGAANITTAQGDIAQIRSLGGGNVVVEWYTKASGLPIIAPSTGTMEILAAATTVGSSATLVVGSGTITKAYSQLKIIFDGISHDDNATPGSFSIELTGNNGSTYASPITFTSSIAHGSSADAVITIDNAATTSGNRIISVGNLTNSSPGVTVQSITTGYINGFRLDCSQGQLDAGTYTLIGIL